MQIDETALYRAIGANLKKRRDDQGLSQAWLADHVGLTRTSITNIEAGRQKLSVHALYAICVALNCELSEVLPEIGAMRVAQREEVAIDDVRTTVPPQTAKFIRSLINKPKEDAQ